MVELIDQARLLVEQSIPDLDRHQLHLAPIGDKAIWRVDLQEQSRWLVKQTKPDEVVALQSIHAEGIGGVPRVLATTNDKLPLMLTPWYHGDKATWETGIPEPSILCLARVHARFLASEPPAPLTRTDRMSLAMLFDSAFANSSIYQERHQDAIRLCLENVDDFAAAAARWPQTMIHGDMHPDNVLTGDNPVVIDWGQARYGPPLIDLTNMVGWRSRELMVYVHEFEECGGHFDWKDKEAEWAWCRAYISIMYVPYAAQHSTDEHLAGMLKTILDYLNGLGSE